MLGRAKWRVLAAGAVCFLALVAYLWAQSGPAEDTSTVYATLPKGQLHHPTGITYSPYPDQELFVADTGHNQIKDCYPTAQGITCEVLAGNGTEGYVNGAYYKSEFSAPSGLSGGRYYKNLHGTVYSWVNLYIADSGNHVLRQYCGGDVPPPPSIYVDFTPVNPGCGLDPDIGVNAPVGGLIHTAQCIVILEYCYGWRTVGCRS